MLKKSFIILAVAIAALPIDSFSQNDVERIKEIIKDFNQDIEKLITEGSSRAEKVIAYTSPNFIYQNKTINVMNLITKNNMTKDKLSFVLHQMRSSGITSKRKLGNLDQVYVRDNLALARFEVVYELYESERMINKGIQYNELIFRKNAQGKWKVEFLTVLNVDEKTYKSLCICEIYETKGLQSIITETIVPDGHQADILEDKFSINESTEPREVRHGFRDYLWTIGGAIYRRNVDGSQGARIGNAKSRQELLLTLLKKDIYPDRCTNVIRKLK